MHACTWIQCAIAVFYRCRTCYKSMCNDTIKSTFCGFKHMIKRGLKLGQDEGICLVCLVQVWHWQKYYAPHVQPEQGVNSWPPIDKSTFHVQSTLLATVMRVVNRWHQALDDINVVFNIMILPLRELCLIWCFVGSIDKNMITWLCM